MPAIDPSRIVQVSSVGRGNIGSLTDPQSNGRFSLPGAYALLTFHAYCTGGSATTGADLTISVDHRRGARFDRTLWTLPNFGTAGRPFVELRIGEQEWHHYLMFYEPPNQDIIVATWTDPDANDLSEWRLEANLYPV